MGTPAGGSDEAREGRELEPLKDEEIDRIAEAVADRLRETPPQLDVRVTDYMSYVAPLPPPEWYGGYERIVPGAGHRILTMVEEEGKHRRWMDRGFVQYRLLGLVFAFITMLAVVGSGVFLIHEDKKTYGFTVIVADVLATAAIFVTREVRRRNGENG